MAFEDYVLGRRARNRRRAPLATNERGDQGADLVDLIGLSIIIHLLPLFAARFGATPLTIGILQATYPMMQFVGAPILGRFSDRFGRKPILIASQFGTLAGFILLGFANTLWLLFISRIVDGLSGANMSTDLPVATYTRPC